MALQRTRRPSLRSGRSLRSLGSPLNTRPFGGFAVTEKQSRKAVVCGFGGPEVVAQQTKICRGSSHIHPVVPSRWRQEARVVALEEKP
jgi:hypothetical protein